MPFKSILFPVDFSERSRAIVPHVQAACDRFKSALTLLRIVQVPVMAYGAIDSPIVFDFPLDDVIEDSKQRLREFAASFPGISVSCVVQEGDPGICIAERAGEWKTDLIMMPTRGHGPFRAALLGSVTAKVLHDAHCAVWTDAHCENPTLNHTDWRTIVCAIDTEAEAVRLIEYAAHLVKDVNAKLYLAHAVPSPEAGASRYMGGELTEFLKDTARQTIARIESELGTSFNVCLEAGGVSEVVARAARAHESDLVLIGRGLLPAFAGRFRSHVYSLVRDMPCPVLSV
ncbi:MAG TPA: universal stress protein [Bryobacteraceae bacterium]|nr:universal stress protein [Bryobacteraceae bacterium]